MKARSMQWLIVVGSLVLLLATYSVYRQVLQYRNEWLQASAREVTGTAQEIGHRLQERRRKVETLRLIVAEVLAEPGSNSARREGWQQDDKGFYQVDPPGDGAASRLGRITGAGVLHADDGLLWQELDAVRRLMPLFRLGHQQDPAIPWIYFISARDFILLYPWSSLADFRYDSSIKQQEFWVAIIPQQNPERRFRWSAAYNDLAGKGMMITASAPVYVADAFRGAVAVDFTLAEFNDLLGSADYEGASVLLFDNRNQLAARSRDIDTALLATASSALPIALQDWPTGVTTFQFEQRGDWYALRIPLDEGATTLYAIRRVDAVWWQAIRLAMPFALLIVLGALLLVLLVRSERAARQIERLTITDGLTGAFNRRHFDAVFSIEQERAQRAGRWFAVLMIDVDHFKRYNDRYGHLAGDDVLRKVAAAMTMAIRRGGDMLFRWGGEEFVVLMSVDGPDNGREIAERVRQAVQELNIEHLDSNHQRLTVSMGLALTADALAASRDAMIRCADQALYQAKAGGRNNLQVSELPPGAARAA
ncbi:diguanylate cyclase [Permianibacter sp. IMCC34836]|uniref:diguanylate cyclase n=1 Tax=Permianibacter fluminis TaxID=2738515 RepID=UPI001557932D|nr:diguanylate cyclase [Permianibacter fluminis]NQD36426.1 diguanylate cyclase [Permianibacter fluminis]